MDATFLGGIFLPGVGGCQELPSIAKLQAWNCSNDNLSEISKLVVENMKNSEFITAPNRHIVAKRMQSQAANEFCRERFYTISFAIEYLD